MSEDGLILWAQVGAGLLLLGGMLWLSVRLERKRALACRAFAAENGFRMDADTAGFQREMATFKLFNQGRGRMVKNLLRGSRGDVAIAVCDYQFTIGSGKSERCHRQTVCALRWADDSLPHFFLRPQIPVFDLLGSLFGGQDVNFAEDAMFSKAYVLQTGGSEQALRDLFDESVRSALILLAPKNVQVEARQGVLLLHNGRWQEVSQWPELIDDALELRATLSRRASFDRPPRRATPIE